MWKIIVLICLSMTTLVQAETKVLAFAGSTRQGSFNKKLAAEIAHLAQQMGATIDLLDLKDYPIPFYDADLEMQEGMPLYAKKLRQKMVQSDLILIASPEYNASISGVLKNALDWASRSEEKCSSREAFKGKKFLLMCAVPKPKKVPKGLSHLRAIIEDIGGTVIPRFLVVDDSANAFDQQQHLKSEPLKAEIKEILQDVVY